jgi:S1-C subfamily serine protease
MRLYQIFILIFFVSHTCLSQSVRNININRYKYIVVDEIIGKHSGEIRRFYTKSLKDGGYNVVNLKEPLKTHEELPKDLLENPDLGLYLVAEEINGGCITVYANLLDSDGNLLLQREGKSCGLLSTAIKNSISGLTSYSYKYTPSGTGRSTPENIASNSGEWLGNGSGIVISKEGHIVTNYHVVKDAKVIEVDLMINQEFKSFNSQIVQVDQVNDLAVIKISDSNFTSLSELGYNFASRTSEVGTKVYAFGYPMALTIMGKELKVTDGIISSKSGFNGDITTYQITAAIQGGNSGGPLFDEKGNLIGINSSAIRKDIADNVGYSIKSNYVYNLIDAIPTSIILPSDRRLENLPLTEQIKEISKYVVLIKVK